MEISGDSSRHTEVREKVVNHMSCNKAYFSNMVDGSFEEHMCGMKLTNGNECSWATEAEITAASICYRIDIFVKKCEGSQEDWLKFPFEARDLPDNRYICLKLENEHFNIVRTRGRPDTCGRDQSKLGLSDNGCATQTGVGSPVTETDQQFTKHNDNDSSEVVNNISFQPLSRPLAKPESGSHVTKTDQQFTKHNGFDPSEVVTNISSKPLSRPQASLLSKGLKFVPTKKNIDKGKLIADLKTWERRMRLREYFFNPDEKDEDDEEETPNEYSKKKQSSWTPNAGRDRWLDAYIKNVKDDVISGLKRRFKTNLPTDEECAMKELLNDDTIVIRPADKGSGIVVMDASEYVDKLQGEMAVNDTYAEVKEDNTKTVENKVKKIANSICKQGSVSNDLKGYMTSSRGSSGKLQGNPKLHKTGMPLRTIVNGRDHPTEKMAELVEDELRNHVTSLPSYIKDTTDFLNKVGHIAQPLPEDTIIFCFDVKALYPSVPRKEARVATIEALNNRINPCIPTNDVLTMMDTVLENNTFSFAGKHYIQTEGTAIGSHLGMNYASTYLGAWETELMNRSEKHPLAYFRFVDDVWGLWTHGIDSLKAFHELSNQLHPRIQLTLRYSNEKLEFLDVMTMIRERALVTDLYSKETDKHLYLHQASSHPETTKKAIPFGLGVRIKRICSEDSDYQRHRGDTKTQLQRRGYSEQFVETELGKVDEINRDDLLHYNTTKKDNTRVPLVLTFSRALPNVGCILRKHLPALHTSDRMKQIFPEPPVIAFKRDSNLQDILVHKKHNRQFFKQTNSCGPCKAKRCALCPYIMEADTFSDYKGVTYSVRNHITCKSTNVVYAVYCTRCQAYIYVGETGDTLYQRQLLNISRIRTRHDDPVAAHFYTDGHSKDDFTVMGLEKLYGTDIYRKTIEDLWKNKLRTYRPYGINKKE